MTVEQALLTGISAVTSALLFVVRILWHRSEECESDRRDLLQEIEDVKTHNGELRGYLEAVGSCDKKDCSFTRIPERARKPNRKRETTNPQAARAVSA